MDCGGKRSATPVSHSKRWRHLPAISANHDHSIFEIALDYSPHRDSIACISDWLAPTFPAFCNKSAASAGYHG